MEDNWAARRQLQLASIADIQGSVQSHTAKASAALVVHGLLFAGLVTTVGNLGDVWSDAGDTARWIGGLLLLGTAASFVASVFLLFGAAEPGRPEKALRDQIEGGDAFFPPGKAEAGSFEAQLARMAALTSDEDFEREYAAEQVKLANLRMRQAWAAKRGFVLLRVEIGFAGAFLACVAIEAAGGL